MNRTQLLAAAGITMVALLSVAVPRTDIAAQAPSSPEYLALGDSLAVGVGASDATTTAYVPLFHAFLRETLDPSVQLRNLGVSGETSASMIAGGQLAAALAELTSRNRNATRSDDVRVITLDIGGNDVAAVFRGPCAGGLNAACSTAIGATLATFSANLDSILGRLRTAAGPDPKIIVMTYYNALANPACPANPLASQADLVLEGGPGLPNGLNDVIRVTAAAHKAQIADTFGRLGPGEALPDCLHANDAGYRAIAQMFTVGYGPSAVVTPNGPYTSGPNAIVVQGSDSAANVSARVGAASGRPVSTLWVLIGGAYRFYLPATPGIDGGLSLFHGPVVAAVAVLN